MTVDTDIIDKMIEENKQIKELYNQLPDDRKQDFKKMAVGLQLIFDSVHQMRMNHEFDYRL